jgi:hypothetical protein
MNQEIPTSCTENQATEFLFESQERDRRRAIRLYELRGLLSQYVAWICPVSDANQELAAILS